MLLFPLFKAVVFFKGYLSNRVVIRVAKAIKTLLIKKDKMRQKKLGSNVAIPYPAVQRGAIKAEAIATQGITLPFSLLDVVKIPANPPKSTISIS